MCRLLLSYGGVRTGLAKPPPHLRPKGRYLKSVFPDCFASEKELQSSNPKI